MPDQDLQAHGLVVRTQFNEIPPHVEYDLTEKGRGMLYVLYEMIRWEERFADPPRPFAAGANTRSRPRSPCRGVIAFSPFRVCGQEPLLP